MKASTTQKNKSPSCVIIKVSTLQEAKEKVYSQIQKGVNYKEIVKTKYDINGTLRSFNISQISQIKNEFESKNSKSNHDPEKALVFKLFQNGFSPTQVIIKTKLSFEFVKKSWEEYAEINNKQLVPISFLNNLRQTLSPLGETNKLFVLENLVKEAVKGYMEVDKYVFGCCECYGDIPIQGKALTAAQDFLSKRWGHNQCIKN